MASTYQTFLESAEAIAAGGTEIDTRNATSRAYYSAYHRAYLSADKCPENGHFHLDFGVHERLIDRYASFPAGASLERLGKQLVYALRQLKANRVAADYELAEDLSVSFAATQVAMVKQILTRFDQFDTVASSGNAALSGH